MGLLGMTIGALIPVFLLSWLIERGLNRLIEEGEASIVAAIVLSVCLCVTLYGFGNANGGPWHPWPGGFAYLIAGIILCPLRIRSYHKKQERAVDDSALRDTFE